MCYISSHTANSSAFFHIPFRAGPLAKHKSQTVNPTPYRVCYPTHIYIKCYQYSQYIYVMLCLHSLLANCQRFS
jgi:hypothetical protein